MDVQKVLCYLRQNSRIPLTRLSKITHVSIGDLHHFMKNASSGLIVRPTILLDFAQIGLPYTLLFCASVPRRHHSRFIDKLGKTMHINNLYRVIGSFDFIGEAAFASKQEAELFFQSLQKQFNINTLLYHFMVEEIYREALLTSASYYA